MLSAVIYIIGNMTTRRKKTLAVSRKRRGWTKRKKTLAVSRKRRGRTKRKNEPRDEALYNKIKSRVYREIPKHSAYRSGILVQRYKDAYKERHGSNSSPYLGKKKGSREKGLRRWFAEKWLNQRREVGYKYKSDIYRPTRRITKGTPITHGELSKREISRARRVKRTRGRVRRFRRGGRGYVGGMYAFGDEACGSCSD